MGDDLVGCHLDLPKTTGKDLSGFSIFRKKLLEFVDSEASSILGVAGDRRALRGCEGRRLHSLPAGDFKTK